MKIKNHKTKERRNASRISACLGKICLHHFQEWTEVKFRIKTQRFIRQRRDNYFARWLFLSVKCGIQFLKLKWTRVHSTMEGKVSDIHLDFDFFISLMKEKDHGKGRRVVFTNPECLGCPMVSLWIRPEKRFPAPSFFDTKPTERNRMEPQQNARNLIIIFFIYW